MTIEDLQNKETWTEEDYQHSLEILRDNNYLADRVNEELDNELFYNILDFEAGWPENFWALPENARKSYREAFLNL